MAALICLVMAFSSCGTQKIVTVEVPVHDTTFVSQHIHDSVFVENTIKEYIKGDTVFAERWHTIYRDRYVHDTTFIYNEVPVDVTNTEYVEVEKKLSWFQKTLIGLGVLFLVSLAVCAMMFVLGFKKR